MMRAIVFPVRLLAAACVLQMLLVSPARAACPIVDVFAEFLDAAAGAPASSDASIALFHRAILSRHPELYTPDVLGLAPGAALDRLIPPAMTRAKSDPAWRAMHVRLRAEIPRIAALFRTRFPNFRCDFPVYLVPSFGALDGAGRVVAGRPALVIGVDAVAEYETADQIPVFVTHELFHRYHDQAAGFSDDPGERQPLWGALWAEGLATYVSARLNPTRPLADALLLPRDLEARARPMLPAIGADLVPRLEAVDPAAFRRYFTYGNADAQARGLPWRSGYYLGYRVAADLARSHDLPALAKLRGRPLLAAIRASLRRLGRK